MDLDAIQQIFFQECEEGLAGMEGAFAALRAENYDAETINGIFRAVHSIKGGAGAFGHERLQAYTHQYETLLDLLRSGALTLTPALTNLIVAAFDMLADHVAAARDSGEAPDDGVMLARLIAAASGDEAAETAAPVAPTAALDEIAFTPAPISLGDDFDDLMALLGDVAPAADAPAAAAPHDWLVTFKPTPNALDNGGEPLLLLRELSRMGGRVLSCDVAALPPLASIDPEVSYLAWSIAVPANVDEDDIRSVFEFTDGCAVTLSRGTAAPAMTDEPQTAVPAPAAAAGPAPIAPAAPSPAPQASVTAAAVPKPAPPAPVVASVVAPAPTAVAQTIRVDLDKLDRLVNLVGELVITQAMLAQRLSENNMAGISELTDLDHLTRELQESTMAIRAQPMKTVFSRVPRIIRELEGETGKRVRLDIEGEMTEVDKTVVERIGEPLTHLIRNAVDHGLETPEERIAAGKPAEGVVTLSAAHHSGRIVITVSDDGRGIDRARVRAKAEANGLVQPGQVLSDGELLALIFAPGFSTAAQVTNLSGRGVGMDVVKRTIETLRGTIDVASVDGAGSEITLRIPLTLAIIDGLLVRVGDGRYVLPLAAVEECLELSSEEDRRSEGRSLITLRDRLVPFLRLRELFASDVPPDAFQKIVVVATGRERVGLVVDQIVGSHQTVVKALSPFHRGIGSFSGATVLGDGSVALILDVAQLVARGQQIEAAMEQAA